MRSLLWSYLGSRRFPREMSTFEVRRFFTLSGDDRPVLRRRFRSRSRLGAALQLGFFQHGTLARRVPKLADNGQYCCLCRKASVSRSSADALSRHSDHANALSIPHSWDQLFDAVESERIARTG
jgi:hypothetical protein